MSEKKYWVQSVELTESLSKGITIEWEGDDRDEAWKFFFQYPLRFIDLGIGVSSKSWVGAAILQLVEREEHGMLVVRATMHGDARPFASNLRGETINSFGYGISIPRTRKQEGIEMMQDLLLHFVSTFGIEPDERVIICSDKAREYNWIEWFQKVYLQRPNLFP